MSRRIRKFLLGLVAVVALLANALLLVRGLSKKNTGDTGERTRNPFLAVAATANILAITALLMKRHHEDNAYPGARGHCPVCDVRLVGQGRYCSACGSRV
jgi:hypothetical protein